MAKTTSNRNSAEVTASRTATVLFILFMLAVPFLGGLGQGVLHMTALLLFIVTAPYISIQFLETLNRDFADEGGFFADNGLAVLAFLVAVLTFGLWIFRVSFYMDMGPYQLIIMLQCLVYAAIDLTFGLLFAFRIAGSGKFREDEIAH